MADIDTLDDLAKQEILMRLSLEVTRMNTQIQENEFKIFQMKKDIQRLQESINISKQAVKEKEDEIMQNKKAWGTN